MTVSDYIFNFLKDKGVKNAFVITGGQAMFLNDALARCKEIKPLFTHHEQTCTMAADAYSRISGKLGVALVTAGPGSINAINGLVGAWCDSAPIMIISGQSALSCVRYQAESNIRQYGIQGVYIKPFVEKATKFFVTVDDPAKIKYYLEKAYYLAMNGRQGPVWIDVPLDVQRMKVPEKLLVSYTHVKEGLIQSDREVILCKFKNLIEKSKRPLVIAGHGIHCAKAQGLLREFIERYNIPLLTTRLGIDLIESEHPLYIGRPGNYGERSANLAAQTADLIIAFGSRLSTASIGHNSKQFGIRAKKIVLDIDEKELNKPIFDIDLKIKDDAYMFLQDLLKLNLNMSEHSSWVKSCQSWKKNFPVVLAQYAKEKVINSYHFMGILSKLAPQDANIIVDTGSCFHVACQSWKVKKGQKFLTTGGLSSMGWWVAGIGASLVDENKETIIITGDGSLQMNIQEFATLSYNKLPIKLFVLNNEGYLLIRQTQKNYMENRLFGEGPSSGVWCPDTVKVAQAYDLHSIRIDKKEDLENKIKEVLNYKGPVVCEVKVPKWQLIIPRVSSEKKPDGTLVSRNFEDMFPYLEDGVLSKIIKDVTEER